MISASRKSTKCFVKPCQKGWFLNRVLVTRQNMPKLAQLVDKYPLVEPVRVYVRGGGMTSRIDAARGVIAKYLLQVDPSYRNKLLVYDQTILTTNAKTSLPKKPGCKGHSATRQKSYR